MIDNQIGKKVSNPDEQNMFKFQIDKKCLNSDRQNI